MIEVLGSVKEIRHARLRLGRISDPSFSNDCVYGCKPPVNILVEKEDFSLILN